MYSRGREDLAQRRTFSGDVAKRGEDREEVKTQEQDEKIKSTSQDVLDEVQDKVQEKHALAEQSAEHRSVGLGRGDQGTPGIGASRTDGTVRWA
jgi:hypothetical protein